MHGESERAQGRAAVRLLSTPLATERLQRDGWSPLRHRRRWYDGFLGRIVSTAEAAVVKPWLTWGEKTRRHVTDYVSPLLCYFFTAPECEADWERFLGFLRDILSQIIS
jgi:hypothetical protein